MKKILIGIDDSKYAEHAADYGFDLARKLKAEIGLVHIVEPMITPGTMDTGIGLPVETTVDYAAADVMKIQDEQAENIISRTIKKHGNDVKVTSFTDYGSTADGIIKCSAAFGADMIVIGTHSRSGIDRLLMGSVAEHVVRNATIPVLVVPSPHGH